MTDWGGGAGPGGGNNHTHTYADTVKQYAILNLRKRYFTENKRSHPPIYMIVMLN